MMRGSYKYRAFISYNHRDRRWAAWLHRALEGYRVPRQLVGFGGRDGPVPDRLYPVYRDREEASSAGDLNAEIRIALEQSAHLIVICSPHACASRWVNEEILAFKRLGREHRIHALIVDGEPLVAERPLGDAKRECFPPALRFRLAADGTLAGERVEPLAADARPHGDGKNRAKLKLIAAILGIDYATLRRREADAERRRRRVRDAIIAAMALLTALSIAGAAYAYQNMLRSESMAESAVNTVRAVLDEATEMSEQIGVPRYFIEKLLVVADSQIASIYANGLHTPRLDSQHAAILLAFAEYYRSTGDTKRRRKSAQQAVAIAESLERRGKTSGEDLFLLTRAYEALGGVLFEQSATEPALAAFRREEEVSSRLTVLDPRNVEWRRHLGMASEYAGDVLLEEDHIDRAMNSYQASLRVMRPLAAHSSDWRVLISLSALHERMGEILVSQGHIKPAAQSFAVALEIDQRLERLQPKSATIRLNESSLHSWLGDTLESQGDLDAADRHYRTGVEVAQELAASDSDNQRWQREILVVKQSEGLLDEKLGKLYAAVSLFRELVSKASRLSSHDPLNSDRLEDLAELERDLGDAFQKLARFDEAAVAYSKGRSILTGLIASDSRDSHSKQALAEVLIGMGKNDLGRDDLPAANGAARDARAILSELSNEAPDDLDVRNDTADSLKLAGDTQVKEGFLAAAGENYTKALSIRGGLVARDTANVDWQENYATLIGAIAALEALRGNAMAEHANRNRALDLLKRLSALSPRDAEYPSEIAALEQKDAAPSHVPEGRKQIPPGGEQKNVTNPR